MPLQETSGTASFDAYGGGAAAVPNYIEDVFSTYLYTGNGSTQTITNGIDLAGKGGLVWIKNRGRARSHQLSDTAQGVGWYLASNTTNPAYNDTNRLAAFNANGFSLGADTFNSDWNYSGDTYASWTFRKQPKFFDVVTYTGDGSSNRNIAHSLGSVPGCVIIKRTDGISNWTVWHRSITQQNDNILMLNRTDAQSNQGVNIWGSPTSGTPNMTSTTFSVGDFQWVNASGGTYVAYLFAHNAGGFGLTGTDNVISCGSFTDSGGVNTINLGYEPQWVLYKSTTNASGWTLWDTMRGMSYSSSEYLFPNNSNAAGSYNSPYAPYPTATGFTIPSGTLPTSGTFIYIAIRRGPMKTPTTGTSVFSPVAVTSSGSNTTVNAGFPVDLSILKLRDFADGARWVDRLRGITSSSTPEIASNSTSAEYTTNDIINAGQTTVQIGPIGTYSCIDWNFRRAPGFFDEVCWNGTNADQTLNHNLGVSPELLIFKPRTQAGYNWEVSTKYTGSDYLRLVLQLTNAGSTLAYSGGGPIPAAPTATQFSVGQFYNPTGGNVAYLFASCPGVSKVFSFTGNGSTQTINCGFTGGARFVLLKATSTTGDWYVYDTARGMTTLTDPYLLLNSTAAESATLGSVTSVTGGFAVNASILAAINTNGVSYVGIAIA